MSLSPRRPSNQQRALKRIKGEVVCSRCKRPVGHERCTRSDQEVWERLADIADRGGLVSVRGEKWGIAFPIEPPQSQKFYQERWVKSKGEDQNYHYVAPNGWELHIRENDESGYSYTIHYEISPDFSKLDHTGDVILSHTKRWREQNRRILSRSTYTQPNHFEI